jgi:hypothetical protein
MDAKEQFKVEIVLQQINSKLAFCRQSLQLLLDEGGKLGGEELQGLFEIINEAQKTINRILPQINPD